MIVMKFGGTSLATADRFRNAGERIRERLPRRPLVVVSALAGITDALIRGAHQASNQDREAADQADLIAERHQALACALLSAGPGRDRLLAHIEAVMAELRASYAGVHDLAALGPRALDAIAGTGERLSFAIMAAYLEARRIPAEGVDARGVIVTDDQFGRAEPLMPVTADRVRELVRPLLEQGVVPVLPGYIGSTRDGIATTLGRGGSDWSASVIGAALPAEAIEIWTDVDGLMTADPRVVAHASVIPEVSFSDAADAAHFGARVLHPATIKPAVERGIPVWIFNSMNPGAHGTRISARVANAPGQLAAVTFKRGVSTVLVTKPPLTLVHAFRAQVFEVFARHRTAVDLVVTSEASLSLTVDQAASLPDLEADLRHLGEVRVLPGRAVVTVVGRVFAQGLAARILQTVRELDVASISFGASGRNLSFVVEEADVETAVRAVHREFFEGRAAPEAPAELAGAAGSGSWQQGAW